MRVIGLLVLTLSTSCGPAQQTTPTPSPTADPGPNPDPGTSPSSDPGTSPSPSTSTSTSTSPSTSTSTSPSTSDDGPAILTAHNRFRAQHCAPALTWSNELAAEAQGWADQLAGAGCAFDHNPKTPHGENLSYFRPPGALSQEDIAEQWYREVERYDFRNPGFSMEAGHFTQVVWVGTKRMGCGSVRCGGGELWVCNYDPPGNMMNAFPANVKSTGCR